MPTTRPALADRATGPGQRPIFTIGAAAAVAAIANLVIYAVARGLGADLLIPDSPGSDVLARLDPAPVIVSSIVPIVLAGVIALGLSRWTRRPRRYFTILVATGFVLSFIPIVTGDLSAGTTVALAAMHVAAAVAAVLLLAPLAEPES